MKDDWDWLRNRGVDLKDTRSESMLFRRHTMASVKREGT